MEQGEEVWLSLQRTYSEENFSCSAIDAGFLSLSFFLASLLPSLLMSLPIPTRDFECYFSHTKEQQECCLSLWKSLPTYDKWGLYSCCPYRSVSRREEVLLLWGCSGPRGGGGRSNGAWPVVPPVHWELNLCSPRNSAGLSHSSVQRGYTQRVMPLSRTSQPLLPRR